MIQLSFCLCVFSLFCFECSPRSTYWAEHLSKEGKKKGLSSQQLVQAFLDDPNVLMMIVNGHNNISHPKLVSMPLGPTNPQSCYNVEEKVIAANAAGENRYRKRNLLLTAGSNFRFRPAIRQCVSDTMGSEMEVIRQKLDPMKFMVKVVLMIDLFYYLLLLLLFWFLLSGCGISCSAVYAWHGLRHVSVVGNSIARFYACSGERVWYG